MASNSSVGIFLVGSLAVHSLVLGSSALRSRDSSSQMQENIVMVSMLEPSSKSVEKILARKLRHSKRTPAPIKEDRASVPKLGTRPVKTTSPAITPVVRNSSELLADPKNGKVFVNYFVRVKERLARVIQRQYGAGSVGNGTVSLVFVLRADGSLENVLVSGPQTDADESAKNFALNCLKDAAPFGSFPKELGLDRISFNVAVYF